VSDYGVCTNTRCARCASNDRLERYPGPGEYCPDCGEPLHAYVAPESNRFWRAPWPRPALVAGGAALAIGLIVSAILAVSSAVGAFGVRVCTTAMTDGIAREIVRVYTAGHRKWPYRYDLTRRDDIACDVRFRAGGEGSDRSIVARDGIVAIVNPQNVLSRLTIAQVRDVLAGRAGDWSQLGGRRGAITAVVPADGSDAAAIIADRIMQGQPYGTHVVRTPGILEVVRTVAGPSGIRSIGIVPFSAAVPAKVLALDTGPPPSTLSIGDESYPLSVRIRAESDFRRPSDRAAALISFTLSNAAKDLVARTSLVSKNGR
jgi:hypothetical protein